MPAGRWIVHDDFKYKLGNKEISLVSDLYEVRLFTSGSNISDTATGDATSATNEVVNAGYAAQSVTPSWVQSGSTSKFDVSDATFTPSGLDLTARYAALINTSVTPNLVCAHCLLDETDQDVIIPNAQSVDILVPSAVIDISGV